MKNETEEEKNARLKELLKTMEVIQSGWSGIMPNGNIVDRREYPDAIPVRKNGLFNAPHPKILKS